MDHTKYSGTAYAYHGGTFAANPTSLAAGLATIDVLEHFPVYDHIDKLGKQTRERLNSTFEGLHFPAQATGLGSLFSIHLTDKKPIRDASCLTIELFLSNLGWVVSNVKIVFNPDSRRRIFENELTIIVGAAVQR
jgi:glutamate-1-semialdehyde aminotransferase